MSKAIDLAKAALQQSRQRRQYLTQVAAEEQDNRQQFTATYGGYDTRRGGHTAVLTNGAVVPVRWLSNGGIQKGDRLGISLPRGTSQGFARTSPG